MERWSRKALAVDSQRLACRNAKTIGCFHDQRMEDPHLFFQKADRIVEIITAKGIGTDQFTEIVRLKGRMTLDALLFVKLNFKAPLGKLIGGFRSCQTGADHSHLHYFFLPLKYFLRGCWPSIASR